MREPIVQATSAQLLDIVDDLCMVAGALLVSGRRDQAETVVEQAAELLAHRAELLGSPRTATEMECSAVEEEIRGALRVLRWTN